jgi:hypothetical protein
MSSYVVTDYGWSSINNAMIPTNSDLTIPKHRSTALNVHIDRLRRSRLAELADMEARGEIHWLRT